MGIKVNRSKAADTSFRYFLRTSTDGGPLGDTSNYQGYKTDFVYHHDHTCSNDNSNPRM